MADDDKPVTARPNPRAVTFVTRLPAGGFSADGRWIPPTQQDIEDWLTEDDRED